MAAGFTIIWALAWRRQERAVLAIEERDGVRFYVDKTSPFSPIRLIRTPGFGGDYLAAQCVDVLLVSLGGTDRACARPTPSWPPRCGGRGRRSRSRAARPVREWRTMAAIELAWARSARRAAAARPGPRGR